jgi:endonuclease YncB( thermonuclease family)
MKNRQQVTPDFLTEPITPPPRFSRRALLLWGIAGVIAAILIGVSGVSLYALTLLPTPTPAVIYLTPTPTLTLTATPNVTPTPLPSATPFPESQFARVVGVLNVSTIEVEIDGIRRLVYYIGLSAPPITETCFADGQAANAALVMGRVVRLERDTTDIDEIGRLPRYVYLNDRLVNADLIAQGFARFVPYAPNNRFDALFTALAEDADAQDRGCYSGATLIDDSGVLSVENDDCGRYFACNQFGSQLNFNLYIAICPQELPIFDAGGDGIGCNQRIDWGYPTR